MVIYLFDCLTYIAIIKYGNFFENDLLLQTE